MRTPILSFAFALILSAPALAQPIEPQAPKSRLVSKVFSVADLVVPIPDFVQPGQAEVTLAEKWKKPTTAEAAADLIRQITAVVRPQTWDSMGGVGKINFYEKGLALVVINTPDVVAAVAEHIEGMRKLQDVTVAITVRYVQVPVGSAAKLGMKTQDDTPLTFDDKQLAKLMEVVQTNPAANVMQAPKVSLFNGQVGTVTCVERRFFVTGLEAATVNGNAVLVPKNTPFDLGDTITLCGRVSADEQFVSLKVNATRTRLASEMVELMPVTTLVNPVGEPKGKPVPFTQFVQLPRVKTTTAQKSLMIPAGRTVVVGSWTETNTMQVATPVLGELPLVGRLFTNMAITESEVVVLATVNVIRTEPAK